MSKQKLKIDNIEIVIMTNKNTKPIPLTKDMLYIPKKKDEADSVKSVFEEKQTSKDEEKEKEKEEAKYSNISKFPFIAINARIPFDVLRIKTRKEIIKSLFHESEFMKLMTTVVVEQNEQKHNEILHDNALNILKLLFPTSFPFTNDITESMNHLLSGSVVNLGLFEQKQISYVRIDGKVQTVSKVVWLNDIMNHPLYYDFIKTMNKYVEWANKNKDNIEYGGKKVLDKITESIFNAYNNPNYDSNFNESIIKFQKDQESNIKYLYTRDEKRYTEANKNFQVFNLFVNNIHKKIIAKKLSGETPGNIKHFISESLDKFSDLNRVYAVESRHLPDILKKVFKHIKDYSESKFYIFRRNIFDSNFYPILNLLSPDLSSKNSDFKIYDETREKFKKFCSPTLKLKGGLVSMDVSQGGDIKKIQKVIDSFVGITDGELDENNRNTTDFYNLLREFIAQETKKEITISDTLRSFRLGVNSQNFGRDSLPGFQIYVRLDLLDGELNDKNISGIKCKFEDLSLTGRFNKLFYNKPYIWKPDMNPYIKIEEPKQQQPLNKAAAKVGGSKTRKKKYFKRRRTRSKQRRFTFY